MPESYDVIVVGAGVAGGALCTALARDGRRVLVIERDLWAHGEAAALAEPDRIVGELLQPGGCRALRELGLGGALEGIDAQRVLGYGVFLRGAAEQIPYAADGEEKGLAGRSFHNGRFLRRLREIALEEENVTLIEGRVVALDREGGKVVGVSYREGKGDYLRHARAALTVACDGCASNLRRRAAPDAVVDVYSQFVGLVLQVGEMPFPAHGHVVLADPAPILFYQISSTEVRCLVDIPSSVTLPTVQHMLQVLAPQVPEALRAPFVAAIETGNIRKMPNRVMAMAPAVVPGAVLLGDSFNMRHPLTGGGMTVALSDVVIIRDLLREVHDLRDGRAVEDALRVFYQRRKPLSSTINILANALYSVFCATDDPALLEMRDACFEYLGSGGRMSHDPMGMLGGVKPSPALLLTHFFGVALYGCGRVLLPLPTPTRIRTAWALFRASFNIVKPLCDDERIFPMTLIPFSTIPTLSSR